MSRWRRRVFIGGLVAAALIAALVVFVETILPTWLRGAAERTLSETLGRKVTVAGPLELAFIPAPGLSVGGVALANAPWGSEPEMVRVARLVVHLDTEALLTGHIRIGDVELDGARILLERNASGLANWALELKLPPKKPSSTPQKPVVVERASVRDFELVFKGRPDRPPLVVGVRSLDARLDLGSQMVDLRADGRLDDAPWEVSGRLGTLERLYDVRDIDQTLEGTIGGSTISVRGRIRDPFTLQGPNLEIEVDGPDVARVAVVFGVKAPSTGPYRMRGRVSQAPEGVETTLSVDIGEISVSAQGRLSAILDPSRVGASIDIEGPDASVVGGWFNVTGLPKGAFSIHGRVRRDSSGLTLDDVKARIGQTTLRVDGAIGPLPRCEGTRLAIAGSGADLAGLDSLTGLRLPAGAFTITGRFLRKPDGLAIEETEVRIGETAVRASGMVGEPPKLAHLDLTADASGPDLSLFDEIARTSLPKEPFTLHGRIARSGTALTLDGVTATLSSDAASVHGTLVPVHGLAGSDLTAAVQGPDLARAASLWIRHPLPAKSYSVSGRVRVAEEALELEGVEARAGSIAASAGGRLRIHPDPTGTVVTVRIHGPKLSEIADWGIHTEKLPTDPFSVEGELHVDEGAYRIEHGALQAGPDRATVSGILAARHGRDGLDVSVVASGPSVAGLARFIPHHDSGPVSRLPAQPYTVGGKIVRSASGFELSGLTAAVGEARGRIDGTIGTGERLIGTDLRLEASAPDSSLPAALLAVTLPEGALSLKGRVERVSGGTRVRDVEASIGDARVKLSGLLGNAPTFEATDLSFETSGSDFDATLGPITGFSPLPTDEFELSGHVQGSIDQLQADRFAARLGESDIEGSVSAHLVEPRSLTADLHSQRLEAERLLDDFVGEPVSSSSAPAPEAPVKKKKKKRKGQGDLAIPGDPLSLGALQHITAEVKLSAAELILPGLPLHDLEIQARARDGGLHLDPIAGRGAYGGRATGSLSLEPEGDGYRARLTARVDDARLRTEKNPKQPEQAPSVDIELDVQGAGRSLHDIAATSDGRLLVVLGSGQIPNTLGDFTSSGLLAGLLDVLNPFRKSSPYTAFECGIAAAELENGKAAVQPIAARTDKMTVLGNGKVDFGTEQIDLSWTIKPRKGVGITPGSIANPYIKLGGTLSAPSIEAKPLEAAASTGAAVATAGLTLLFRGIYDRITAERKVCVHALEKAKKNAAKREAEAASTSP